MRTLILLLLLAAESHAATFTVTSTADTGGGICAADCTLRQALGAASGSAGTDTIAFNIPGAGPHRISIASMLMGSAVVIDGYTQPGAFANTDPLASNAVLKIIIDARNLPAATRGMSLGGDSTLSGLSIIAPPGNLGVDIVSGSVRGCWFNVEPDGVTVLSHGTALRLAAAQTAIVGGPLAADRNVFAAASPEATAIIAGAGGSHTVQGNIFGLRPDGQTPGSVTSAISSTAISAGQVLIGNTIACTSGNFSVLNFGAVLQDNRLGTTVTGSDPGCSTSRLSTASQQRYTGNTFGYFDSTPVSLASTVSGVVFRGNRIVEVAAVPFDLNGNGFTANDADDSDTGANGLQNFPVLGSARIVDGDHLELSGTLRSTPGTSHALDFYASTEVTRSAFGSFPLANGERVSTTSVVVTTDAGGLASFGPVTLAFDGGGPMGVVSATATRLDGNGNDVETSEYGAARATYTAGSGDFVVTNTNPSGPGSLLRALLESESRPDGSGRDRVVFNIPGTGPHTLSTGVLTAMTFAGKLELDGLTQPGSSANTSATGIDAQLRIDINAARLTFNNADALVRGVVLRGSSALLTLAAGGSVEGSFIGVGADGLSLANTVANTVQISCGGGCRVGGPAPAQRNLIACPQQNSTSCIDITAANARVEGNLIGVQRNGLTRLVTPVDTGTPQIFTALDVRGGTAQIRGNTIGGFTRGIRMLFSNHIVEDNRIGVGVDGSTGIANARNGLEIFGSGTRILGNHIAHNVRDGVLVRNGTSLITLVDNRFDGNGELGIDLDVSNSDHGDGVSLNDPLDADAGPNTGQNFPVLSEARRDGSGVVASVSLNSTPNQSFRLRYCYVATPDASGHGECDQPISGVIHTVTTDANGNFSGQTPTLPLTAMSHLTATAAVVSGIFEGTSEFAQSTRIADVTTTTISADTPDPSVFGQAITVSVAVAGQSTTPTGTVNVGSANGGSCSLTLSAGSGSCALTPGGTGAIELTANYAGTAEFAASSDTEAHAVAAAATATTILADTPDPSTFGDAITVTFRIDSTPAATGTVTVSDGVAQCQGAVGAGGNGSCVLTPGAGGNLTLTASYAGSANFAASSDDEPHSVNAVASALAILGDTPDPSVAGQPVNVAAQLTSSVGTPAGPIVISDGAGASCQIDDASGNCNLIPINAGSITLRADFAGTPTHLASTAATTHAVDRAATTLAPAAPIGSDGGAPRQFALVRFPVTIDVTAPGAGAPGGSITVTGTPGVEVCVITLPAGSCDLIVQTAGSRSFDVHYSGDSRYQPSSTQVSAEVRPDALFDSRFEEGE